MRLLVLLRGVDWTNPSNIASATFIIGWALVSVLVTLTIEVSIGLSAFSALMWSTLPWAFPPLIDKEESNYHVKRLYGYLHQAIQLFFVSALFFVGQILDETTKFFALITYVQIPGAILLYGGLVCLVTALGFTYLIVDYVTSPEDDKITEPLVLGNELFLIIGLTVFEVINGYALYGFGQYTKGRSLLTVPPLTILETILFSVSVLTYFYALKVFRERSGKKRVATLLVFFSPYIFLISGYLLGFVS